MAEDTKNTEDKTPAEEGQGAEIEKTKKPFNRKVIFIAAGFFVLIALAAVGYFVFAPSSQASPDDEQATTDEPGEEEALAESGNGTTEENVEETKKPTRSPRRGTTEKKSTNIFFTDFEPSVVNLAPSENYNYVYLKYGFNLELGSDEVRSEVTQKMPKLASIVDTIMSGSQWDKVSNAHGREALAKQIVEAVNAELETGEVISCLFTTFVAQ